MAASRDDSLVTRKADFSSLWGDERLADVVIKIKLEASDTSSDEDTSDSEDSSGDEQAGEPQQEAPPQQQGAGEEREEGRQQGKEGGDDHQQQEEEQEQQKGQQAEQNPPATPEPTLTADKDKDKDEDEDEDEKKTEELQEPGVVATLRVHAIILAQRSAYFDRMLRTDMKEGREKAVTVTLLDEEEVAEFKRLIKLSYTSSYVEEDGRALTTEILIRLLVLADSFEMVWCMEECTQALLPLIGYEEGLLYFEHVPDSLVQIKLLAATTKGAGNALAAGLGPVEKLWRPGEKCAMSRLRSSYRLDGRVKILPLPAIEAVLRSQKLELKSENDAFSLALWWATEQEGTREERQATFNRLLKSLRYAHMSCVFLASISYISSIKNSGLWPSIIGRGIWRRGIGNKGSWAELPPSRVKEGDRQAYTCSFITHFAKADVKGLRAAGDRARAPLGLLHGFPCRLKLSRYEDDKDGLELSSDFLHKDEALDTPGEPAWSGQDMDDKRGFQFKLVRGTFGGSMIEPGTYHITVKAAKHIMRCSRSAFAYDEADRLQVELELAIEQRRNC